MDRERLKGNLDLLLLSVLSSGPAHGYAIISALRDRSGGTFDLPEGTIYPALHRLEDAGLLVSTWDRAQGRRRRIYGLTDQGAAALAAQQTEWRKFAGGIHAVLGWAAQVGPGEAGMSGVAPDLIAGYLEELYAGLRVPVAEAELIAAEAEDHLRETAAAGIAIGMTELEAQQAAISSFGPVRAVVRAHRRRTVTVGSAAMAAWKLAALLATTVGVGGLAGMGIFMYLTRSAPGGPGPVPTVLVVYAAMAAGGLALLATRRLTGRGTPGRDRLSPGVTASCFLLASALLGIFGFLLRSAPAVPPPAPSCSVVCNVSTGPAPGHDPGSGPVLTVLVVYAAMAAGALVLLAARRLIGYGTSGRDRLSPGVTASCFLLASAPLVALIVSGVAVPIAPSSSLTWTTPLSYGSVSAAPLVSGAVVSGCLAVAAATVSRRRSGGPGAGPDQVRSVASWVRLIAAVRAVRTCESRRGSPEGAWRARLLTTALLLSVVSVAGCTGSSAATAHGTATAGGPATPADVASDCLLPPISCYAPALFRVEYGIRPLLDRGIDGRGETVTVLAVAPSPGAPSPSATVAPPPGVTPASDIHQDLAAFDGMFRLPAARIQVVTTLAGAGSPWKAADEEAQDTEIVHTVAPAAALRVVLLPSNALDSAAKATADMIAGLRLAVSGTDVALISFSLGEHYFTKTQVIQMRSILLGASAHHVTVIAGSGDNGGFSDADFGDTAVKEVSLPASDPFVLAAGGTSLNGNLSAGFYISETAWNGQAGLVLTSGASGGGFSHLYARPAYQDGVHGISTDRGVPDVAGEADQESGWAFVFTGGSKRWIMPASGTSASASLWGGVIALADQYAHHDLGFVNPAIYRIARSSRYHQAFRDITTGSNIVNTPPVGTGGYQAGPGWDPATGWGSPDTQVLVPLLAA